MACLVSLFWLHFYTQFSGRPAYPEPQLGFVHRVSGNGVTIYLSDAEATARSLLEGTFLIVFLTIFIFGWDPYRRVILEPAKPEAFDGRLFLFYLAFYFAAFYWTGPHIVSFVVSHGIVLAWAN
jgi:hypothetical protein